MMAKRREETQAQHRLTAKKEKKKDQRPKSKSSVTCESAFCIYTI